MSDEIRDAASESARQGGDLRERVHDLTLEALKARRFDREAIRDVVRAVTEGITQGAEGSRLGVRQTLAEGFRGMDQALTTSVQAGHEALRQMLAAGRSLSENEVKQAAAGLRKLEEDFVATVEQVARTANERVRPELTELVRQAAHAGTETGRRSAKLMAEFTLGSLELAGEFGARFAQVASGILSGMADALDKRDRRKPGT
jgi:Skp family chaperone for outer membrane proteins